MVIAIAGAALAAGTIATGAVSASQQAGAARDAARGQQEAADQATQLQREMWEQGRQDIQPWRQAGIRGLRQFEQLARQGPPQMGLFRGVPALNAAAYAFRPPTEADMLRDPGYQFRMQQGQQALERSAAARGGLLSGGFARNLTDYAQGVGSQEYGNVYQRKMGENQLRYGRALTRNQSAYERALQQYQTRYNAGLGTWKAQLAPWQTLAGGGQQAGEYGANLGANYASQIGSILQANANAQGAAGMQQANIWSNFANQSMNALGGAFGMWGGGMGGNNPASVTPPMQTQTPNPWAYWG